MKRPYFYCRKIAAPLGSNRYYAARHIPFRQRKALFGLYALDNIVFSIPFLVKEPQIAQTKLRWWRHAILDLFETKQSDHPVLQCLIPYLATPGWNPNEFIQYIDHVEAWLDFDTFETNIDFLKHSAKTSGIIASLALYLFMPPSDKVRSFANHFAASMDLNHFFMNANFYAKRHKIPFSHDILSRLHLHDYELLLPINSNSFTTLLRDQVDMVKRHQDTALALFSKKEQKPLRYFHIMFALAIAQLDYCIEHVSGNTEVKSDLDMWPLKKWWISFRAH